MRGVVKALHSYQRPSLRQSHRNPVLLPLIRTLQAHSLWGHDGLQAHLGLPAALSVIPLARSQIQRSLTNCSNKFCRVLCCCTTGPRGTRIVYGMAPDGLYTSASSSIFPQETQHDCTYISSTSSMTIGSSTVSPPPRSVDNNSTVWLCFPGATLLRWGCMPCDCVLTGEAGLHKLFGSGSRDSSFSRT